MTRPTGGVCLLTSSYPSPHAPTRGAFVEDIAKGLTDGGPVTVVVPHIYPDDPAHEVRHGCTVRRFGFGSTGKLLKEYGGTPLLTMMRYMASGLWCCLGPARRADWLFAHWVIPTGVIGAAVSYLTGRPLVLYAHGSDIAVYAEKSPFYRRLARFALGRARLVFAASSDLERRLVERLGVPPARVRVVPCGVDTSQFSAPQERVRAEDQGLTVLFVGDQVPTKGVPELVQAVTALLAQGQKVRLEILGDGPLRQSLAPQAAASDGAITFHGAVPRPQVADWMGKADLLVLPSHSEGTPVCVMEALSCGLPVVASRVGGIPDLIDDGKNGLLVPAQNVEALTAALKQLASEPALLESLTTGAMATGDRFSLIRRRQQVRQALAGGLL